MSTSQAVIVPINFLITIAIISAYSFGCTDVPQPSVSNTPTIIPTTASEVNVIPNLTGQIPAPKSGTSIVLMLEPENRIDAPVSNEPIFMDQFSMTFIPSVLVTQVNQPVHFTNSDQELHNVRVVHNDTRDTVFNVGTPAGGHYEHVFDKPGIYAVMCDVHTAMGAAIFVSTTPYVAIAAKDGNFAFSNVIPGRYKLKIHSGGTQTEKAIEIKPSQLEILIDGL